MITDFILESGKKVNTKYIAYRYLTIMLILVSLALFLVFSAIQIALLLANIKTLASINSVYILIVLAFDGVCLLGFGYWFKLDKLFYTSEPPAILTKENTNYKYHYERLLQENQALNIQLESLKKIKSN